MTVNNEMYCDICGHNMGEILTAKDICYVLSIHRYDTPNDGRFVKYICGECANNIKNSLNKHYGVIKNDDFKM